MPDLFWRQEPAVDLGYSEADWKQAFAYYQGFDEAKGMEDLQTAITALRGRAETAAGKVPIEHVATRLERLTAH